MILNFFILFVFYLFVAFMSIVFARGMRHGFSKKILARPTGWQVGFAGVVAVLASILAMAI